MIKVVMRNNAGGDTYLVDENTTLRATMEENGFAYEGKTLSLDGSTLRPGDLDKTFAQHGITEKCYLMTVAKVDNASF